MGMLIVMTKCVLLNLVNTTCYGFRTRYKVHLH